MALPEKPPVVTILGHVDHGKTTLLDYIRKTKLAAKEIGEITQAIGAYQIEFKGKKITFIDTPGHAAFSEMRSRGAKVADIVVLVIAVNDGVMPQTLESIKIIKEANVPVIIALNKIDLPGASIDKVKTQLAENGVLVEGYGGNVVAVPLSAKTGQGVDQLLEMILLTAEMEELKADPAGTLEAEVIEAKADKFCGPVGTVVIKNGTLKKGDRLTADGVTAKVKLLKDEWGRAVSDAKPADPAQILGFTSLPAVGAVVRRLGEIPPEGEAAAVSQRPALAPKPEGKLSIILKADVAGSLEAILNCLPDEVQVAEAGVGEVTESDVLLAKTFGVGIYTFNLPLRGTVAKLAETEGVKVKSFRIIYDLLGDLEKRILKILEPTIDRKILGKAEIIAAFDIRGEKIAGARVLEGKINRNRPIVVQRDNQIIAETKVTSLKQEKQDINEAVVGTEFGIVFAGKVDFKEGDMILSYSLEEK
ncbi:MAG TPA: translation initiation factor IF-2 [Patescibacteria group bacterium]|nr:translation initiation factor IF-2 [Patescibacteria group bacterium]